MAHTHSVRDDDRHFIIDSMTRIITTPTTNKPVLSQYDHNSEHITFEIDRFVEGHDLYSCDKVEIHYNNIEGAGRKTSKGLYEVVDLRIMPSNTAKVTFTWVVSEMATEYNGGLHFVVSFVCTDEGDILYRWNTKVNSDITISEGINNSDEVAKAYADVLEMWKLDLFGIGDTEEARMLAMSELQQEAIEVKGKQTLATIPDDYVHLQATVDELLEDNFISQTSTADNVITETFDDGRKKVTTIDGQVLTESWYSTDGALTKSKTITISQNGVTETMNAV